MRKIDQAELETILYHVFRRTIRPPTAALEHINDPLNHPPVIDPPRAWLVLRQMGLDR